ncbi:MAG: HEAT repeat domain-containing protein, partial [Deltaproteobacteria bacterium]|nr:HEAT repeat domain-containing protein [Deltaproteobacteria bacterium]
MRPTRLVLLTAIASSCTSARPVEPGWSTRIAALESAEVQELIRFEDARLLADGRIEALTRAAAPAVRTRALLALARLQAPETAGIIAAALDDPQPDVRAAAAFALGVVGLAWGPIPDEARDLAVRRLAERGDVETDWSVGDAIVEALGRIGGPQALATLVRFAEGPHAPQTALALGVLSKSSAGLLEDVVAVPAFAKLLDMSEPEKRFAGAYALMRYQDAAGRSALRRCTKDQSYAVRAACGRGLAALGDAGDVDIVSTLLDDPDERVAAEAGRGLAKLVTACAAAEDCPALRALESSQAPWRIAVAPASAAAPIAFPAAASMFAKQIGAVQSALEAAKDDLDRRTLALEQCELALGHDRALGRLDRLPSCGHGLVAQKEREVRSARALSEAKQPVEARAPALMLLAKSPLAPVRAASAAGLAVMRTPETEQTLIRLLADPDWTVASEAAGAVEAARLGEQAGPALIALLERAKAEQASDAAQAALSAVGSLKIEAALPVVRRLTTEGAPHVRLAAARAMATLTGHMPAITPPPWKPGQYVLEKVPPKPVFVRLSTERGPVRIQLFEQDAPLTVRNFLSLVRKGFYQGLTFHRVVPAFVAQGGDPKGDGTGGPGYTIRCEANRRSYGT